MFASELNLQNKDIIFIKDLYFNSDIIMNLYGTNIKYSKNQEYIQQYINGILIYQYDM